MQQIEFDALDESLDVAARRAAQALLALEGLRRSADPAHRAAYRHVHDLLADLGGMKMQLGVMDLAGLETSEPSAG